MTNPNNSIGTNGAYGGRTSVDAFNDVLGLFNSRGVLSGFKASASTGLTITIGGDGSSRDVAIAEDNAGNKTTINNISKSPISLTLSGAPAQNSRIDSIVAYVDKPSQGSSTQTDNPSACGLIIVSGSVASTPNAPDENTIRSAITNDGANGTNAYYVVLANITMASGTTVITNNMIFQGIAPKVSASSTNGTTLYENNSGQGLGNFSLSDTIENYDTIEIYYKNTDNISRSNKFRSGGSTASTTLQVILPGGGTDQAFYVFASHITFAGSNANHYACKSGYFNNYNQMSVGTNSDAIKIYKIVGYK